MTTAIETPTTVNKTSTALKVSKSATLARVLGLITGTQKHFPNGSFTLGNVTYTAPALIQDLQSLASALTALNAAHVSVKDALAALAKIEPATAPLVRDYTRYVLAAYASAPQQLADFGMQPPKARTPLTSAQLAARAAKSKATRAARGTAGRKQKAAVTGNVTGVDITPVTSTSPAPAAPPAATQQPAPATPAVAPAATK
jgi:hypothetical protein